LDRKGDFWWGFAVGGGLVDKKEKNGFMRGLRERVELRQ